MRFFPIFRAQSAHSPGEIQLRPREEPTLSSVAESRRRKRRDPSKPLPAPTAHANLAVGAFCALSHPLLRLSRLPAAFIVRLAPAAHIRSARAFRVWGYF